MMFDINYIWIINCCLPWLFITMIELRSFKAPDSVSGVEIMNTTHSSNKRRKINENFGDIRCRDQFCFACFQRFFFHSTNTASFLFNLYWNMLRYVNYARVIYKRLPKQRYKKGNGAEKSNKNNTNGEKNAGTAWLIHDNVEVPIVANIRMNQWRTSFCVGVQRAKVIQRFFFLASKSNEYRFAKDWIDGSGNLWILHFSLSQYHD